MKTSLKLEELAMFLFSIYLFNLTSYAWWVYLAFILLPDIGMLGYAINTKIGAISYNLFHHKAMAIAVLLIGYYLQVEAVILSGIILFGHSSMDRIFGYGLKYPDDFKHTHLGMIGQK